MRGHAAKGIASVFAIALVLQLPVVAAECVGPFCRTDESAGDTSTPCEDGVRHDPRYRYKNASVASGNLAVTVTLTFACESNPPRAEYFWGNVTLTDGARNDQLRAHYYYGQIYLGATCSAWVDVDPDWLRVPSGPAVNANERVGWSYSDMCPSPERYPSVVSTLP